MTEVAQAAKPPTEGPPPRPGIEAELQKAAKPPSKGPPRRPGIEAEPKETLIDEAVADVQIGTALMRQATAETVAEVSETIKLKAYDTLEWAQQKTAEAGEIIEDVWEKAKDKGAEVSAVTVEKVIDVRQSVADFIKPE